MFPLLKGKKPADQSHKYLSAHITKTTKKTDDGQEIFEAIVNTLETDRVLELVVPKGGDFTRYIGTDEKPGNPVVLDCHKYDEPAIGKGLEVRVEDDKVVIPFIFAKTERGEMYHYLYSEGIMRAFSIGYIPKSWIPVDEKTPNEFEIEVNDGEKFKIDLSKLEIKPEFITNKWEMLEFSCVPVPCNAGALMKQFQFLGNKLKQADGNTVKSKFVADAAEQEISEILSRLEKLQNINDSIKGIVPFQAAPTDESEWDGDEARAQAAIWASSDGSGEPDTIDYAKYALIFVYFPDDEELQNNLTAYKLPYKYIKDGELVINRQGTISAMGALLGARGGVDIPQEQVPDAYAVLAEAYKLFDLEPPELRDYTEEELQEMFAPEDGNDNDTGDDQGGEKGAQPSNETIKKLLDGFDALGKQLNQLTETNTKTNVKLTFLIELVKQLVAEKSNGKEIASETLTDIHNQLKEITGNPEKE